MSENRRPENIPGCLSAEVISEWVHDLVPGNERSVIEAHVRDCPFCRDLVEAVREATRQSESEGERTAPADFTRNARQLVNWGWESLIADVVVKLANGVYAAVETTGRVLAAPWLPSAVSLRGQERTIPSTVVIETVYKQFRCRMESSRSPAGRHTLTVALCDIQNKRPIRQSSVVLFLDDEEIESQVTVDGRVVFEDLLPGSYRLEFSQPDGLFGHMNFHLIPT